MGITKKIDSIFLFLFLIIFPFGQIIRLSFNFAGLAIPFHPIDLVVGLGAIYSVLFQKSRSKIFKYLNVFLAILIFSFILSIFVFGKNSIYGIFYLIRLISYTYFLNYVWNFVKSNLINKRLIINSLILATVASAFFGWIQFFMFPDIKPFFVYGWDMHLFRLVGTFLDPTFLGLIIVFGLILSINRLIETKNNRYLLIIIFLLISLAFTYSRASYLAFLGAMVLIAFVKNRYRKLFLWVVGLLLIVLMLPTAKNHSIELTRTFSITAKFDNYQDAIEIFKKFPVFGVGYNNFCYARNKFIGFESFSSHACSGSDSSLLLILATCGVVGFIIFISTVLKVFGFLRGNLMNYFTGPILVALFVHSLFSNSLFFPWILGFVIILLAVNLKE